MSARGNADLAVIRDWVKEALAETPVVAAVRTEAPVKEVRPDAIKALPEPIAITGVAGFFPGCEDVETFWRKLDADETLITRIPKERFGAETPEGWGGFLKDVAGFDARAFGILPMEAEEMDPRVRLLLMSTWRTLEDAGIEPVVLRKSKTGVFVACEGNDYAVLMGRAGFVPKMGMGQANSMVANRVSYQFDFAGPSEMVDATCAGFAVALHRAVVALRAGLIDRAIVGAANVILLPDAFGVLKEAGQLTAGDMVKSFGRGGDGFLRAEGVGTILIERRESALAAGRGIYAEIKHTAVNFNGRGGVSMASPNTEAHAEVIKACYREAGIDPRELGYVEAQGMGSPVADIAEWAAINRALTELCAEQGVRAEPGFCRVSTLKPMLGHMHSASSLGALLKVVRSFQTGRVHKVIGFTEANEYCDMNGTPCRIATETEAWEVAMAAAAGDGRVRGRLAAVHAYGSGGNNAHVLLEEAREGRRGIVNTRGYEFKKERYWFAGAGAENGTDWPKGTYETDGAEEMVGRVLAGIRRMLGAGTVFDGEAPFTELGLDSLSVGPFVARLESEFGVTLRKSDVFSYATPVRLARHVAELTRAGGGRGPARKETRAAAKDAATDDVAIIGVSLQVAGAENAEAFWRMLREGRSGISEVSEARLGGDGAGLKVKRGGWLSDVDTFDPLFFKISPKEAASMDPRHRKLLQAAWAAIDDSGHSPEEWRGGEHGIFIGIEESDYPYDERSPITSVHGGTAPARIGYFLDTKGPVLAISTACSSSLVAVHYACRSILSGESECALAGGVNLICQPARSLYALSQMGDMLSPDGTCYAFDGRANGMVLGEGVGLVVLKRLSQARRDGDPVYAVIKGSGINYDGKTNGLTAPNGGRQRELLERVYRESGVEVGKISYVVAHGTGTALGDPVECNALIDAFGAGGATRAGVGAAEGAGGEKGGGAKAWCALTSPKTNVGHTQAASGVVNLIAAALAVRHGEIPPTLNYEAANEDIAVAGSPFYVNTALRAWEAVGEERFAAVSSFGHTGTNAHVVLGGVGGARGNHSLALAATGGGPVCVVLSAKDEERLREAARGLLACAEGTDLEALAYTLQVGRVAMEERLGLVVASIEELKAKLGAFLEKRGGVEGVYRGTVKADDGLRALLTDDAEMRRLMTERMAKGEPAEVVKLWVNGLAVEWTRFYGKKKPRRLNLPTYPFAKERYWLKTEGVRVAAATSAVVDTRGGDEAGMEVMTFAEEWVAEALPVGSGLRACKTVVCWLADAAEERAWREALRGAAPEVEWRFGVGAMGDEKVDAVVCLPSMRVPETVRDVAVVLPWLRAVAAKGTNVGRLVWVCPFRSERERCDVDAWVACERSLKPVLAKKKVAVLGVQVGSTDEGAAMRTCVKTLVGELAAGDGRSALYGEDGRRSVLRIVPAALGSGEQVLKRGGVYLITGGGGGLGGMCTEHLVKQYAAKVVLVGRSAAPARELSGEVIYVRADVGDAAAMRAVVAEAKARFGVINGVIHAAGVAGAGSVIGKTAEAFNAVLHPKVRGTVVLDDVLGDEPLDFVVYFSSGAAVLGDFGSCDYAVANRFQNAYARYRNARVERGEVSGRTMVINWPVWAEGGMGRGADEQTRFYLKTSGQRALETAEGMALFERLLGQARAQHLVVVGKPERVRTFLGLADGAAVVDVESRVQAEVRAVIGGLLEIEERKLGLDVNLADFGFDSISLATFAEHLGERYGVTISPAVFFGYSTIRKLGRYLIDEYGATVARERVNVEVKKEGVKVPVGRDEPIAVIGMSGRFPQARTIDEMWRILAEGRDAVTEVPAERFDWREFYGDPATDKKKSNGKWMGCLPGVAEFDPLFFEISPSEAETMDPRQRHLLQESWKALENAGVGPRQLAKLRVGMFVGVEEGDYAFLAPEGELTSNHNAILASRLAYLLDFRGPAMAINTACSSGLVAAHQACASLRNGECDAALVAAVSLQLTPAGHIAMGQAGMLSADGKCRVFDKRANGLVPGEACVALVLKRLSQAEAEGNPIHAVIRASGMNYDGKTNGITAPNGVAQAELLKGVYEAARIDVGAVEYVVAHGTGTRLGDPVEVNALQRVFAGAGRRGGACALTSTKSNFGHTFAASGLVSAVSLIEAFRHGVIPASLHCEQENDFITWAGSPLYVNKWAKAWVRASEGRARMGAVSAFGMSGTNAHMVFEEYVAARARADAREGACGGVGEGERGKAEAPGYLLVLSAKTAEALREQIDALAAALGTADVRAAGLASVSYTLLEGRHHFEWRVAVVARDVDEAIAMLKAAKTREAGVNFWRGRVSRDARVGGEARAEKAARVEAEELMVRSRGLSGEATAYRATLGALGELYCRGYEGPWCGLFGEVTPKRVALPTYPFARETYWVAKRAAAAGGGGVAKGLHPLVQVNTSDLGGQRFGSTWSGAEFFLEDHRVRGERVLPGAAYLEMARAALAMSVPQEERGGGVVTLSQMVWVSPLVVGEAAREVQIELTEVAREGVGASVSFEVLGDGRVTHATGKIAYGETGETAVLDVAALRGRMTRARLEGEGCYAAFRAAGVEYGPAFQGLRFILVGEDEVLARIALPGAVRESADVLGLHPSVVDTAFQATLGLAMGESAGAAPRVPFALEEVRCFGASLKDAAWVWARRVSGSGVSVDGDDGVEKFDLEIADDAGRVLAELRGFSVRALPTMSATTGADEERVFARIVGGDEFYVADHGGVLPGVVSLEWARAAGLLALGRAVSGLRNVVWNQPLRVEGGAIQEVRTTLTPTGAGFAYQVSAGETVHAQGLVVGEAKERNEGGTVALEKMRARCGVVVRREQFETLIDARLGPGMRSLVEFRHDGGDEAFAVLRLPAGVAGTAADYVLHPSLLNGALQACTLLARIAEPGAGAATPFGVEELWIHGAIPTEVCVRVVRRKDRAQGAAGARLRVFDVTLMDRGGNVVVSVKGYTAVSAKAEADAGAPRYDGEGVPLAAALETENWRPDGRGFGHGQDAHATLFAVAGWKREAVQEVAGERAAPVVVLTEATAGLRVALERTWPGARVEVLPRLKDDDVGVNFGRVLERVQSCARDGSRVRQPILLVAAEREDATLAAACAGLFRTARLELPRLEAKVVRVATDVAVKPDGVLTADHADFPRQGCLGVFGGVVERLRDEVGRAVEDVEVRLGEGGVREVRTMREVACVAGGAGFVCAGDAVWITGGLGGVGRVFARYYGVERKARVFLSGRSALDAEKRAFLSELEAGGAKVRYLQGDVARVEDVKRMVKTIVEGAGRLCGVLHCAGVIEDAYLVDKRAESVERVWGPKVAGALALDQVTREMDLEFVAFFSSLTGSFGNAGQCDYAGANAFLDAFAEERNRWVAEGRRRGRTVSVAWPLWRDGGMGMDAQSEEILKQRSGMTPMAAERGVEALERVLGGGHAHVLVMHGDRAMMRAKLFGAPEKDAVASADVRGLSVERVEAEVRRIVAEQQKIAPEKIEADVELPRYGFDSIRLTALANQLNRTLGVEVMPTLFFEYTTVRAIARYLTEKHGAALAAKLAGAGTVVPAHGRARRARVEAVPAVTGVEGAPQPIAIVGVSGRFPGAENVEAFWRNIEANRDLIREVPAERWDWRAYFGDPVEEPGKTNVKSAGFMDGIDRFDAGFFGISPREAVAMDPQVRLLLETVWATIEDAGYRAGDLSGTKTGVFVGVSTSDYKEAWMRKTAPGAKDGPALVSHFVAANRISYALNLNGPSEPIDTACSSSLIAIHRAIESMRQGGCEQAIVGGVNVICTPDIMIGASRAGMLSADGRCKTFDEGADGYGRGEGVGALLLKPLDAALRDGDHVYALIRGSGENHGGRAQSPTAPNPAAQRELLVSAYTRAGVDPRTVGYIEAHGTGTVLGDPIEVEGLSGAFAELYRKAGVPVTGKHCGVGSVKTNVGHLEAAAGIAGVLKVVMMLKHGRIPGNGLLRRANPYLRLEETPFYLVKDTSEWAASCDEQGRALPRRAGVSSFGIGGSNAHVILEEWVAVDGDGTKGTYGTDGAEVRDEVVVLSAKTEERLRVLAGNLRAFLSDAAARGRVTLREVAYTLQVGREALEERVGFGVASMEELVAKLGEFVDGRGAGAGVYRGRVARRGQVAEVATDERSWVEQWVGGTDVAWADVWRGAKPRRVSLPTYPFARTRYWFEVAVTKEAPVVAVPVAAKEAIETFLVGSLAKILYLEESAVARDESFVELGLDSVLAVEWVQAIKVNYGIKIPATKVYAYPTVVALADYLAEAVGAASADDGARASSRLTGEMTLDEVLEAVRLKRLSVEEAEQLIEELGLECGGEDKGSDS